MNPGATSVSISNGNALDSRGTYTETEINAYAVQSGRPHVVGMDRTQRAWEHEHYVFRLATILIFK